MSEIVLLAISARWSHPAFGARSLIANLGDLRDRAELLEANINERALEIVERVLNRDPHILGIGVYIWNTTIVTEIVNLIRSLKPHLTIVLGGPEVIDHNDLPLVAEKADYIVSGEAEVAFRCLCSDLLEGRPVPRLISPSPPPLDEIVLPYDLYTDDDIKKRKIYVEASRGCPFGCEFCLSSRDEMVRKIPPQQFINALDRLWERGVRHFKFVDRAIHYAIGASILEFFLERIVEGAFLHFEIVPDHLPKSLIEILGRFPAGSVQLEAGVQTLNPAVGRRINRQHNIDRLEDTFLMLRKNTGAHIHADLIVGLPGETMSSFGEGFDRLLEMGPHEIQVGMLKRLRGTPVADYDRRICVFNPDPPYEILQSAEIDFFSMQRLRRFARYFDLYFNSGNFKESMRLLFDGASAFSRFFTLSEWLFATTGETHHIALNRLARLLASFLIEEAGHPAETVTQTLAADFVRRGKSPIPLQRAPGTANPDASIPKIPPRQSRHQ